MRRAVRMSVNGFVSSSTRSARLPAVDDSEAGCRNCQRRRLVGKPRCLLHQSRVRPKMNSAGDGNRVCFPNALSSHSRTVLPSVPRNDPAEHAAQPIGLLPYLWWLQSHVACDKGGAARRKGTAACSSPHRRCHAKLSRAPAPGVHRSVIHEDRHGAVGHVRKHLRSCEVR